MATLQSVLQKLVDGQLTYGEGPKANELIEARIQELAEQIQPLTDARQQLTERVQVLTKQLAEAPQLADLEKLAGEREQLLLLREQFATKEHQQTEQIEQLAKLLDEAPKPQVLEELQQHLQTARQVLDACKAIFGCQDHELEARIQALQVGDGGQLALIAQIPGMPEGDGTTVEKVQEVIAQANKLQQELIPFRDRAGVLEQVRVLLGDQTRNDQVVGNVRAYMEILPIVRQELFIGQPIDNPGHLRAAAQAMLGRVQVLNDAKAQLGVVDDGDFVQAIQGRDAARVQELRAKDRELADEQSFTGTVWRIVNGMVNGFVSTLKFFFISIPTYVIDTLRYLGGVFAR